jgi:hypothetical protein
MKPRSTIYLVSLAVLLFGFIWLFERHQRPASMATPDRALPGLRPASVTRVQVRPAGQPEILAERTNNVWMLTRPTPYPAVGEAVEQLLHALSQLSTPARLTGEEVRQRPQADKEFGFEPPAYSLVIGQGAEVMQILVGKLVEPLKDAVFVRVVGLEGVLMADATLLKLIPPNADAWRTLTLVDLREQSFDRIAVTNGARAFEFERGANGRWRLAPPVQARADHERVEALLAQLQAARVGGFVNGGAEADLEPMGLQPPELSLTFLRGTNPLTQLAFGRSLTNDPALLFARNSRWATTVLAPADAVAGWRGTVAEFRDRRLVSLQPSQVDEIEFRGPAAFTLQRVTNEVWQIAGTNAILADPALVFDLLSALSAMEVSQLKDVVTPLDFPNYGLEPPAREILLRTRPASGGDTNVLLVQLAFGTNQAGTVFARRTDEKSVYGLRQRDVLRLAATPWATARAAALALHGKRGRPAGGRAGHQPLRTPAHRHEPVADPHQRTRRHQRPRAGRSRPPTRSLRGADLERAWCVRPAAAGLYRRVAARHGAPAGRHPGARSSLAAPRPGGCCWRRRRWMASPRSSSFRGRSGRIWPRTCGCRHHRGADMDAPAQPGRSWWRLARRLFRWVRIALLLVVLGGIGFAVYLNRIGLPGWLRERLVAELRGHGLELNCERLRWKFYRGLVATDVTFGPPGATNGLQAAAHEITILPDVHALRAGRLELREVTLTGGVLRLALPATNGPPLEVALTNLNTTVALLANGSVEFSRFNAHIGDVAISLSGTLAHAADLGPLLRAQANRAAPA